MSRFKFRAWDKNLEEMVNVSALCLDDNILIDSQPCIIDESNDIHLLQDTVLMQYTGFKDCNGIEIYEGDIVRCTNLLVSTEPTFIGSIEFRNGSGSFCVNEHNIRYHFLTYYQIEVIGNIYDDSELLENEK